MLQCYDILYWIVLHTTMIYCTGLYDICYNYIIYNAMIYCTGGRRESGGPAREAARL